MSSCAPAGKPTNGRPWPGSRVTFTRGGQVLEGMVENYEWWWPSSIFPVTCLNVGLPRSVVCCQSEVTVLTAPSPAVTDQLAVRRAERLEVAPDVAEPIDFVLVVEGQVDQAAPVAASQLGAA